MVETVIFDLDGTLLNTLFDLKESTNFVLKKYGFPLRTLDQVRTFVGNGVTKLFERALPQGTDNIVINKCVKEFKEIYSKNMYNNTAPYPGILNILKEFKSHNIKTGIVSNKFDSAVKELSKKYFCDLIDIAIGQSDNIRPKPCPDGILKIMEELRVKSGVYVGDSDVDILTAKNANIPCIGVCWGFRDKENLKNADYIAETPDELSEIIMSL